MSKHTPGPWTIHPSMPECVTFSGREGVENLLTENVAGYFCFQSHADARLVAAAPDLLAVLCVIADWTERYTTKGHPISTVARDAIAHATGGQQ